MPEIYIHDTFNAIFGMDQMCTATVTGEVQKGDVVLLQLPHGETARLTIGIMRTHRNFDGEMNEHLGIGLRGDHASEVKPGDVLIVEAETRRTS